MCEVRSTPCDSVVFVDQVPSGVEIVVGRCYSVVDDLVGDELRAKVFGDRDAVSCQHMQYFVHE